MFSEERIKNMKHEMVGRGNWKEVRRLSKIAEFNGVKSIDKTASKTKLYGDWC